MKNYLKLISLLYGVGAVLHVLDLFDLRLQFSKMDFYGQLWIIFLTIFDSIAAVGLWIRKKAGEYSFLLVAFSQIFVYTFFKNNFGDQNFLIFFHLITLSIYLLLMAYEHINPAEII